MLLICIFFSLLVLVVRLVWWAWIRISIQRRSTPLRLWSGHADRLPLRTLVVLGSGGHTTEMLGLLRDFDQMKYRCEFILAETDSTSVAKVTSMRPDFAADLGRFHVVPRSREVGQAWSSSAVSTAKAFCKCLGLVWRLRPQVLLVNGPGTCVPVVAAALLFELLAGRRVSLIVAESFCRVKSLSLTGRLLYPLADVFVVHWPGLVEQYPKAMHCGVLM
eukprot:gnl/TRDRNA2_/TRDRNA2_91077_c0_seq1.p1 gnl/TRDRNA2_/TRDRNA2_91077_c0~~gnl/TRDRNA2_/TRDRNA2_91077_c0_seq1.p1  ORF type:complete len:219 (+),score=22.20 gnl/TRDRNA2_/TRDRNA2_91077_c0_seq1:71-727(+)